MAAPMRLDYAAFTYLAVILSPQSPHFSSPTSLATRTAEAIQGSNLQYVGRVGELDDVQLFSVPKNIWDGSSGGKIIEMLKSLEGVKSVDVQVPKTRSKRGGEL
ncbi:hypothetical protein RSOL_504170 [Rhizoctonia solani AG-3 Rhs1AP]|uniref:Uncharacterized protein n=1 Tax=Rhizoctonia solani AG-3 Rhs1AP TaxID=1086054 RepID=X8JQH5_9AGAM|nr:hypothetical protein RSOL_504170 [Rhizoctonia solani AG-3 Rhs1AP]